MRKSFDGLSAAVRQRLNENPLSGHLFVFVNRRATQMKILYFDRTGYAVWGKRLERGRFVIHDNGARKQALDFAQLQCLIDGIEIRQSKRYKRFALPAT